MNDPVLLIGMMALIVLIVAACVGHTRDERKRIYFLDERRKASLELFETALKAKYSIKNPKTLKRKDSE